MMIRHFRRYHIPSIVQKISYTKPYSYSYSNTLTHTIPVRMIRTFNNNNNHNRYLNNSTLKQQDECPISTSNHRNNDDDDTRPNTWSHGYIQAPDSGPIMNHEYLNVTDIHEFLADRLVCLVTRDLQRLKQIDNELELANVFVDDIAKQWRADGKRFAIYLRNHDTTNNNTNTNAITTTIGETTTTSTITATATTIPNVSDNNNNNGFDIEQYHKNDYYKSPYSGPIIPTISEAEIHTLLAERHYLRRIRDYDNADKIRKKELEVLHGILIDDKHGKWHGSDGTQFQNQTHNYIMSRDSGPMKVNITEEEIHNMLNKRHRCRLRKDYKGADVIYEKLKNCGVSVDDEIMEWRADGIQFSTFLRWHGYKLASDAGHNIAKASETDIHKLLAKHWSYKQAGNTKKANDIWADLSNIGVFLDVTAMEWRADGLMHNYRLSQDAGKNVSKVSDTVIHHLLEQRMLYRWKKNFTASDQIRDKLKRDGVYIDDINKEWRADGNGFHHLCHQYHPASDSGPLISTLPERIIHKLLSELWQWKLAQCFDKSDAVSDDLFNAGVYVNDKKEIWRGDGKTCNFDVIPYAGPFNTNGAIEEEQMHRLLEESFRLRLRQKFDQANHIHDQLYNAGIFLDLTNNLYRADGVLHCYQKSPISGPTTSHITEEEIHRLLAERWQCKILQNFSGADRIFDELYDCGVFVDDETMEWRADGVYHTYRPTPDAGPIISKLPIDEIHTLIGKRVRHKKFKDFVKADRIMQYLRSARVHLDDKKKEWRADGAMYDRLSSSSSSRKKRQK